MPKTKITTEPKAKAANKEPKKPAKKAAPALELPDFDAMPILRMQKGGNAAALAGRVVSSMGAIKEKLSKKGVSVLSPAELRKSLNPIRDIYMQYAVGAYGFRNRTLIQIIGEQHVGKTAWMINFAGQMLEEGNGVIWIDVDNKPVDPSRFMRYLSTDPEKAKMFLNSILFATARNISQVDADYENLLPECRKLLDSVPESKGRPIYVFVDDWSSGKSKSEAAGRTTGEKVVKGAKAAKKKDIGKAEGFGHSKHAQAVRRALPELMDEFNASFVISGAMNDKVDMQVRPGMAAPSKSDNQTTIGGNAFKSLSAYRFTLVNVGKVSNKAKVHIGHKVKMRCVKNCYGPKRDFFFTILFDDLFDTPEKYAAPLSYAEATAEFFSKNKILGVKIDAGLITSDELDVLAVTPEAFYEAFMARPDLVEHAGARLAIEGYSKAGSFFPVASAADSEDEDDEYE